MDFWTARFRQRSSEEKSPVSVRSKASADSSHSYPTSPTGSHSPRHSNANLPLPHTDPLPVTRALLEGRLNHHASQLQNLADRVDWINEVVEMESIVLGRLVREVASAEKRHSSTNGSNSNNMVLKKDDGEGCEEADNGDKNKENENELKGLRGEADDNGESTPKGPPDGFHGAQSVTMGVKDIQRRVEALRRLRRALERSVVWQRDEYWRVEKAIRREKRFSETEEEKEETKREGENTEGETKREGEETEEETKREGEKTEGGTKEEGEKTEEEGSARGKWLRESGRLPTQREWELMFED